MNSSSSSSGRVVPLECRLSSSAGHPLYIVPVESLGSDRNNNQYCWEHVCGVLVPPTTCCR